VPPKPPLPRQQGLDASWVRTPDNRPDHTALWTTMRDFLLDRLPTEADVDGQFAREGFVDGTGRAWRPDEPYRPNAFVWFHRPFLAEATVPGRLRVILADERIVVVDKPHFLATTPRGIHVVESVVAKLRQQPGWEEIAPAHRLDRLTAGVLVLTIGRRWRAPYAGVFSSGQAEKTYEAIAPATASVQFPLTVTGRIEKTTGRLQAELVDGEPNSSTLVELVETNGRFGRYRLTPHTGKTHQLRLHLASLGIPIVDDPLYPAVRDVDPADFSTPLKLVARRLAFADPVDGTQRYFTSGVPLPWPDPDHVRTT